MTFQDEYGRLLERYPVAFDERYVRGEAHRAPVGAHEIHFADVFPARWAGLRNYGPLARMDRANDCVMGKSSGVFMRQRRIIP